MSATLDRDSDPERPSRASSTIDPVQAEQTHVDAATTAVAEPEPEEIAARNGASAGAGSMIVRQDARQGYEPNVTARDGVAYEIEKGEFVFVVGAAGSG